MYASARRPAPHLARSTAWRPALLAALPAVLVAGLTRCGGDATGPAAQLAGTYTLRTINGQALPFVLDGSADSLASNNLGAPATHAITASVLTLKADSTLGVQVTVQATPTGGGPPSAQTTAATGTWTSTGAAVTLRVVGSPPGRGTFSGGNTLTVAESFGAFVYQR